MKPECSIRWSLFLFQLLCLCYSSLPWFKVACVAKIAILHNYWHFVATISTATTQQQASATSLVVDDAFYSVHQLICAAQQQSATTFHYFDHHFPTPPAAPYKLQQQQNAEELNDKESNFEEWQQIQKQIFPMLAAAHLDWKTKQQVQLPVPESKTKAIPTVPLESQISHDKHELKILEFRGKSELSSDDVLVNAQAQDDDEIQRVSFTWYSNPLSVHHLWKCVLLEKEYTFIIPPKSRYLCVRFV